MFNRICNPLKSNSFFLFGARGTGKSTLLQQQLTEQTLFLDLLEEETFDRLLRRPQSLEELCSPTRYQWIVIDEVQRLPKLLNVVHRMIEKKGQKFALTGSSARKLKRGSANLLAGRAFVNHLFPLTSHEMDKAFDLVNVLHWGSLPKVLNLSQSDEKKGYLRSYSLTYVKEEIQAEQIIRKLEPFREFLSVAAQMSGKIINYSSIAREVGAQVPTVQSYYQILEDTYLGFLLPHFHRSIRKSQIEAPKFYFFDNGVKKALEGSLDSVPAQGTSSFGELFEAFVIQEIDRLNHYWSKDFRLSFYRTKGGSEVDLILSKGRSTILIEIKSSERLDEVEVRQLARLRGDFGPEAEAYYLSRDPYEVKIEGVDCLPWRKFLDQFKHF
ncbi:MAG: ATP-binding protein [Bdellovibrionota bacterium]